MGTDRCRRLVLTSALGLWLAAAVTAQQAAFTIAPRDQLKISVWNGGAAEDLYSGTFPVDADGAFEYPTLGRLKAAGLTPRQLEADLKTRLEKYLVGPQVTIELEQSTTKKVVINGEVRSPGAYQFGGDMTLFEVLTRAGSLTEDAAEEAVVHRAAPATGDPESLRVDLADLLSGRSMKNNLVLRDGDIVVVPKSDPVFVTGFVHTQGPIRVKRDTTVLQALSMAGGLTDRGTTRGIRIQRLVDGKKKDIPVKDINADVVRPGDTLVVPARIF
ncbi:MAG: polysaccharide biosynthesis/export family protein [Acidobacteria bacterium]|nr:polysaccharide biosynthesis/export family protein [Acidobacteriota bacterium]